MGVCNENKVKYIVLDEICRSENGIGGLTWEVFYTELEMKKWKEKYPNDKIYKVVINNG